MVFQQEKGAKRHGGAVAICWEVVEMGWPIWGKIACLTDRDGLQRFWA
jgi:hypothetical protein